MIVALVPVDSEFSADDANWCIYSKFKFCLSVLWWTITCQLEKRPQNILLTVFVVRSISNYAIGHFAGVHTSFPPIPNGEPPPYEQTHTKQSHVSSQLCLVANDRAALHCKDQLSISTHQMNRRSDSPYSALEFTVELNGYAEFGPFPPNCTSRGTSTAKDCGNIAESGRTGLLDVTDSN